MCIACEMANVPVCAATGPCMSMATQMFHYALIVGAVGLGTTRLFFRRAWDGLIDFMSARYGEPPREEEKNSPAA